MPSPRSNSTRAADRHTLTRDQVPLPHRSFLLTRRAWLHPRRKRGLLRYTVHTTAHNSLCPSSKDNSRVCTPHFCTDILGCHVSDTNLATTNPFRCSLLHTRALFHWTLFQQRALLDIQISTFAYAVSSCRHLDTTCPRSATRRTSLSREPPLKAQLPG